MANKNIECKICGENMSMFGNGTYYLEDGVVYPVPYFYCNNCNTFIRQIGSFEILSHLKAASHTNIKNEERFFKMRKEFFKYVFSLTKKHSNEISNWLDIGCSYGHLIEYLRKQNIDSVGIELSDQVREYAQSKNLTVFKDLAELGEVKKFDVVSLIDSLYYVNEPVEFIKSVYSITNNSGLLVLRVTNRNWLAKLKKNLFKKDIALALGDSTISYSKKSIKYLLENNGYEIVKITSLEKGKVLGLKTKLFYNFTFALSLLTFRLINISPGLIVVARKKSTE